MRRFFSILTGVMMSLAPRDSAAEEAVEYARDIAPIFRTYCAGCHDDVRREGKFSVETYASLRRGGEDHGDPVRERNSDESFLLLTLDGKVKPKMPPKDEPQVPERERATLKRWVDTGAVGPARDVSILKDLVAPRLPAAKGPVAYTAVGYSADGRRLALGRTGAVEIWDTTHQALVRSIGGLPGKVNAVHFSPDGSRIVAASGVAGLAGMALLHDVATGEKIREYGDHRDLLYDAEFSPDGAWLATAGYDRIIQISRVSDGASIRRIDVHKGAVFDLAWHPGGTVLASASADETVKLWRVSDGARLDTLNQPQGEMFAVRFTPDGSHILATGSDKRIHAWRFVTKDGPGLNPVIHSRFAHESAIQAMELSSDGRRLLTSASDGSLKLWSVPDLDLLHGFPSQPDLVTAIAAVPKAALFFMARLNGTTEAVPATLGAAPSIAAERSVVAKPESESAGVPGRSVEIEPNDSPNQADWVQPPVEIAGSIRRNGDHDLFRFAARAGVPLAFEVNAARSKSSLDSRVEILNVDGSAVEQVVLQAVRDSWFTFRGKDSETVDDFRLHNWAEMELNEYLYANGEVVRLWLYPRGPDSGFKVYPGEGRRHTYFGTTALSHALGAPCYVVKPFPPGTIPAPNGLPVFRIHWANDDDPGRQRGTDSFLIFDPPRDGEFLVRVGDVRGFGGDERFPYTLAIRPPKQDFKVSLAGTGAKVSPGSGREINLRVERFEGFDGPIRVEIDGLPKGFTTSSPIEIEQGQMAAVAVVYADTDAVNPDAEADGRVRVTASADIGGRRVRRELGTLGDLQLAGPPKVTVEIMPSEDRASVRESPGQPLEFTIRPGQTITAKVKAVRNDFPGRIEFGNEDSGRNLPHGVYVDNIGLNGLLIVEGQSEREFFVTASRVAKPGTRMFHLRARADDGQASRPVLLRILPDETLAAGR